MTVIRCLLLFFATSLLLPACAARSVPVMADPQHVFDYAKRGNWRVRAFVDGTMHEGRVAFVGSDRVRIFDTEVMIADIDSVHRLVEVDKGGKVGGALLGGVIGAAIGGLGVRFAESMGERPCGGPCAAEIMVPTTMMGSLIGMMIGAGLGPAERSWKRVWKAGE